MEFSLNGLYSTRKVLSPEDHGNGMNRTAHGQRVYARLLHTVGQGAGDSVAVPEMRAVEKDARRILNGARDLWRVRIERNANTLAL